MDENRSHDAQESQTTPGNPEAPRPTRRTFVKLLLYSAATIAADLQFASCMVSSRLAGRGIQITNLRGEHPGVPVAAPSGRTAVSVNQGGNLSVVDLDSMRLVRTLDLSIRREPWEAAFTPDGRRIFVTHSAFETGRDNPSFVTALDFETGEELAHIQVGLGPNGIAIEPEGRFAFVANNRSHEVSVIDVRQMAVTKTLKTGSNPFDVAVAPDGRTALVVNFHDSSLSFIDIERLEVTGTVPVGRPGVREPYPHFGSGDSVQIAVHPEGSAFISNYRSHEVVRVDLGQRVVTDRIPCIQFPFGIAVYPNNGLVSVMSGESRQLGVIDLETRRQIDAVPLGEGHGKPPLRLTQGRAAQVSYVYVDPIRGYMYEIPGTEITSRLDRAGVHAGA